MWEMLTNKSIRANTAWKLYLIYTAPMEFIRKLVFRVFKLYYKDANKVPSKVLLWCFPITIADDTDYNCFILAAVLNSFANTLAIDKYSLRITKLFSAICHQHLTVDNEYYDEFWNLMKVPPNELPKKILEYSISVGDVSGYTHSLKMESDSAYKAAMNKYLNMITRVNEK